MDSRALLAAGVLVAAGGLAGCGGSSSSSSPVASKAEFCGTFSKLSSQTSPKTVADALARVGTPKGIPASAKHGFDVLVAHLRTLPSHASQSDLAKMAQQLTGSDQSDVMAFVSYYAGTCQAMQGLPSAPAS